MAQEALASAVELLLSDKAPRIPQEESEATYAAKLDRESGRIEWSQDCWYLDRLIRAMNPWPGAFTLVPTPGDGVKKLKIHRALPVHRLSGNIGTVRGIGNRGVLVGCGQGALLLLEVQLEGKRRMNAVEFVRGFAMPVGNGPGRLTFLVLLLFIVIDSWTGVWPFRKRLEE